MSAGMEAQKACFGWDSLQLFHCGGKSIIDSRCVLCSVIGHGILVGNISQLNGATR